MSRIQKSWPPMPRAFPPPRPQGDSGVRDGRHLMPQPEGDVANGKNYQAGAKGPDAAKEAPRRPAMIGFHSVAEEARLDGLEQFRAEMLALLKAEHENVEREHEHHVGIFKFSTFEFCGHPACRFLKRAAQFIGWEVWQNGVREKGIVDAELARKSETR